MNYRCLHLPVVRDCPTAMEDLASTKVTREKLRRPFAPEKAIRSVPSLEGFS